MHPCRHLLNEYLLRIFPGYLGRLLEGLKGKQIYIHIVNDRVYPQGSLRGRGGIFVDLVCFHSYRVLVCVLNASIEALRGSLTVVEIGLQGDR